MYKRQDEYDIANLVYAGKGGLFDAIRRSIDPVKISHPLWDEKIILNDLEADSWAENYKIPAEADVYKRQVRNHFNSGLHVFGEHGATDTKTAGLLSANRNQHLAWFIIKPVSRPNLHLGVRWFCASEEDVYKRQALHGSSDGPEG